MKKSNNLKICFWNVKFKIKEFFKIKLVKNFNVTSFIKLISKLVLFVQNRKLFNFSFVMKVIRL